MSLVSSNDHIILYIDSTARSKGTPENFAISLNTQVQRVAQAQVVQCEIPFSMYVINSGNVTLIFKDTGGTTRTVNVAAAQYTGASLATVLQTGMNVFMAGFTVAYNDNGNNYTFSNAAAFQIIKSGSTIDNVIGLTADSAVVTSFTTQGFAFLSAPLSVGNNTLIFKDTGSVTRTVIITTGNYDGTSFATAIQNGMNAFMAGFTVSFDAHTYKISFANAAAFQIIFAGSTLSPQIGLTADSAVTTIFKSQNAAQLSGPNYLMIRSSALANPKIIRSFFNSVQDSVFYKVSASSGPGTILVEKNLYSNPLKYGVRQTIQNLDFQLVDPTGAIFPLNGLNWSLTVDLIQA